MAYFFDNPQHIHFEDIYTVHLPLWCRVAMVVDRLGISEIDL